MYKDAKAKSTIFQKNNSKIDSNKIFNKEP